MLRRARPGGCYLHHVFGRAFRMATEETATATLLDAIAAMPAGTAASYAATPLWVRGRRQTAAL
jgi:hypothetical protein